MTQGRMKTYSAQNGYVYQYSLVKETRVEGNTPGTQFLFEASTDRKTSTRVAVLVSDEAVDCWRAQRGRALAAPEIHAAAKLRLWQAMDEATGPEQPHGVLVVSSQNLLELLGGIGVE